MHSQFNVLFRPHIANVHETWHMEEWNFIMQWYKEFKILYIVQDWRITFKSAWRKLIPSKL